MYPLHLNLYVLSSHDSSNNSFATEGPNTILILSTTVEFGGVCTSTGLISPIFLSVKPTLQL